jgi:hypothetical protein
MGQNVPDGMDHMKINGLEFNILLILSLKNWHLTQKNGKTHGKKNKLTLLYTFYKHHASAEIRRLPVAQFCVLFLLKSAVVFVYTSGHSIGGRVKKIITKKNYFTFTDLFRLSLHFSGVGGLFKMKI